MKEEVNSNRHFFFLISPEGADRIIFAEDQDDADPEGNQDEIPHNPDTLESQPPATESSQTTAETKGTDTATTEESVASVEGKAPAGGETGQRSDEGKRRRRRRSKFERQVRIVVTQPRRVAAISVATRVSQELGVHLGNKVQDPPNSPNSPIPPIPQFPNSPNPQIL